MTHRLVAGAVAGEMAKTSGQCVFVDNKPGAARNIAMQEVANSTDGHALVLGHMGTPAVNPCIFAGLLHCTGNSTRLPQLPDVPSVAELDAFIKAEQARWKAHEVDGTTDTRQPQRSINALAG